MFFSLVRVTLFIPLLVFFTACNSSSTDNTQLPSFTSETLSFGGLTYVTVQSPRTGRVWLDRNLGAGRICESATDEMCFGDFYQWGRGKDGHEQKNSSVITTKSTTLSNVGNSFIADTEWLADGIDDDGSLRSFAWSKTDGSSVCPVGFRVPTISELSEETAGGTITNSATAYTSFWKVPTALYRGYSGPVVSWEDTTCLWSSDAPFQYQANPLCFDSGNVTTIYLTYHAIGHHIRCIQD